MKISLIVEGKTEKAFIPKLREHLQTLLPREMPNLHSVPQNGRVPRDDKLDKSVNSLLHNGNNPADHVIALTDVYPDYSNAANAKASMRQSVKNPARFHAHAAQYEFEAWLLPYWDRIQQLAGHNQSAPGGAPEQVNNQNPPSSRIKDILRRGHDRYDYVKTRDAGRILDKADLNVAIQQCPELKSLVDTILSICGGQTIP
jgi:hypothetical protein